jgi:hypothetical protein
MVLFNFLSILLFGFFFNNLAFRSWSGSFGNFMFSSGSGPVILEARGESKSWGLYNFFLIHIGNSYVNMMLLKIKKNHHGDKNYHRDQRLLCEYDVAEN